MSFWSGEKLSDILPALIVPFDASQLDCASYLLSVGEQVFATSDKFVTDVPNSPLISVLGAPPNHTLRIRPGQFAFLMTEEIIEVPSNAIALISMRSSYKFKGLINVSGFHVDPGWKGRLLFSVYNAGPSEIIAARGDRMFMIVYADLDRLSSKIYNGSSKGQDKIKPSLLQNMTEQVFSPLMLQRRIEDLAISVRAVENTANLVKAVTFSVTAAATLFVAAAALFAAFAPATLGVIVGKIVESGGYELRQKAPSEVQKSNVDTQSSEGKPSNSLRNGALRSVDELPPEPSKRNQPTQPK
jgi:dCTP deaminase